MKQFGKLWNQIEDLLAGVGTIAGLSLIFINVVMRYIFHKPISWTDEICVIILAWAIIIGFSISLGENSHIRMDVVYDQIKSPRIRGLMDLFSHLVGLLYGMFITFYGAQAVGLQIKTARVYPITEFPRWIAYSIIVFTGAVMTVRYVIVLIKSLKKVRSKEDA